MFPYDQCPFQTFSVVLSKNMILIHRPLLNSAQLVTTSSIIQVVVDDDDDCSIIDKIWRGEITILVIIHTITVTVRVVLLVHACRLPPSSQPARPVLKFVDLSTMSLGSIIIENIDYK
jgi:hypothetical protein